LQGLFQNLQKSIRDENAEGQFDQMPLPSSLQAVSSRDWILRYLDSLRKRSLKRNKELKDLLSERAQASESLKELLITSLAEEDDVSRFISALSRGEGSGASGSAEYQSSDTKHLGPSDASDIPYNAVISNQAGVGSIQNEELANDARQLLEQLNKSRMRGQKNMQS